MFHLSVILVSAVSALAGVEMKGLIVKEGCTDDVKTLLLGEMKEQ